VTARTLFDSVESSAYNIGSAMTRAFLIPGLLGLALTLTLGCSRGEPAERPNLLFLVVDDLNDWIGIAGGHPQAHTPRIDALAASGVFFRNAHAQAPGCIPSRASMMTGLLPSTTGIYFAQLTPLDRAPGARHAVTWLERLAAAGYHTAGVGKVHDGDERQRFQRYAGFANPGSIPGFRLAPPTRHAYWDWGPLPAGAEAKGAPDLEIAGWAARQLREGLPEPFVLAVGFHRPHVPMYAPREWFEQHPLEDVVLPEVREGSAGALGTYAKLLTEPAPAPSHEWFVSSGEWKPAVRAYLASSSFVDACVGLVLDALDQSSHARNTTIILLSDNGFHLGQKERWGKRSLWTESTRVPLIVSGAGVAGRGVSEQPVGLIDLHPTILELAGLPADDTLDGQSLVPLVADPSASRERPALATFGPGNHAVQAQDWRYIRYADGSEELYDHGADPLEWANLADDPSLRGVREDLARWLPASDAIPFAPTSTPEIKAWKAAERYRRSAGSAPR
jgi:choline-sulfatase